MSEPNDSSARVPSRSRLPILIASLILIGISSVLPPIRRLAALTILQNGPSLLWARAASELGHAGAALDPSVLPLLRERAVEPALALKLGPALLELGGPSESRTLIHASIKAPVEQASALRDLTAKTDCAEELAALLSEQDQDCARAAALCLIAMEARAAPARRALHGALDAEDRALRRLAAQCLSQLPQAESSIPAILKARESVLPNAAERDDATREAFDAALQALILSPGYLDGQQELSAVEAELVLPQMRAALSDERPEAQRYALSQLAKMGFAARSEVKKVLSLAPQHRELVLLCLERIASPPQGDDRSAILELALESLGGAGSPDERRTALRILAIPELESPPQRSIAALLAAFDESDEGLRHEAMASLSSLGSDAIQELLRAFDTASPERRERLAAALALMGSEAVPELAKALRSSAESRRLGAAMALGLMEGAGLDALIAALDDETLGTRDAAVTGLILAGAEATGRLLACLEGESQGRRIWALFIMGRMGDEAASATQAILEFMSLERPIPELAAALDALQGFSARSVSAPLAEARLFPLLDSRDPTIRARALARVLRLAPKSSGLDAALERLASDPVDFVAREARAAKEQRAKER